MQNSSTSKNFHSMAGEGGAIKQNETFLALASQFGFGQEKDEVLDKDAESEDNFGEVLLKITTLQEDISKLKLKEQQANLSKRFAGLTQASSLSWLLSELNNISSHLTYITNNSGSFQHKLTNPVISNSLPLKYSLHTPLINITNMLAEISTTSDTAAAASEWLSNQDWNEATDKHQVSQQHTEKLAARLRSAAFKLQTFREHFEHSE